MDKMFKVGGEFKADAPGSPHAILRISGYASTKDVDSTNEVVEPTSFAATMTDYMNHPMLLFGHDWYAKPIGKVVDWSINDTGLFITAEIADTAEGRDVARLIEFGILKAFSIGFRVVTKTTPENSAEPTVINKLKLYEISVVNLPANLNALIDDVGRLSADAKCEVKTIIKINNDNNETNETKNNQPSDGGGAGKESRMSVIDQTTLENIKKAEELAKTNATALDSVSGDVSALKSGQEQVNRLVSGIQEELKKVQDGLKTQQEANTDISKMATEVLAIKDQMERIKKVREINDGKMPFMEWHFKKARTALPMGPGNSPMDEKQSREYMLFHAPVEYDSSDGAQLLKRFREVSDTLVLVHAYMKGRQRMRYGDEYRGPQTLKTYGLYRSLLDVVDPEFAKMMYSTATGYGDEYVPTGLGNRVYDLYTLDARVESLFEHFTMPTNPFQWPTSTSRPTMYRAGEPSVNNPYEVPKSQIGTSNVTFSTETYVIAVPFSQELVEDAIVNMAGYMQDVMAKAMVEGYESCLLNGDNTAVHRDTAAGYTAGAGGSPETYEDGLRMIAIDRSATLDTTSTSVGDATSSFGPDDVRYMRLNIMKAYGTNPSEVAYITSYGPYRKMLSFDPSAMGGRYGVNSTYRDGNLDYFDGSPVVVSSKMPETLESTGMYTGSSTFKGLLAVNKTAFMIGEKRGYTVDYDFNAKTRQACFVATQRKSFQCLAPSTLDPVAYGIEIS